MLFRTEFLFIGYFEQRIALRSWDEGRRQVENPFHARIGREQLAFSKCRGWRSSRSFIWQSYGSGGRGRM